MREYARKYKAGNRAKVNVAALKYQKENRGRIADQIRARHAKDPERLRSRWRAWDKVNANKRKAWALANSEMIREKGKRWRDNNRAHYRALRIAGEQRRRLDPVNRVKDSISRRLRHVLQDGKRGIETLEILSYSVGDLRRAVEAQFIPGMSWDNYGAWHLDHERPVATFDFSGDFDAAVKACWSLNNLRPLWAEDNLKKGRKWSG